MGSSSLLSIIFIFGGGGGGGGLMLPTPGGEEVDDTIAPDEILNSFGSVLNTIVEVCIIVVSKLNQNIALYFLKVPLMPLSKDNKQTHALFVGFSSRFP